MQDASHRIDIVDPVIFDQLILRPSVDVQNTTMDSKTLLLELNTAWHHTLNLLGSVIWNLCTGPNTVNDMRAVLCDRI
ncbi:MAG: hypothetical protein QM706_05105 [Nitrospira sp.]